MMECAIAALVVSGTRADDEVPPPPTATPVTALRSEARIHPTPHPQCPSPALPLPPSLSSSVSHNPSSPCAPTATPRPRSPHPAVEEESAVDASSSESSRRKPIRAERFRSITPCFSPPISPSNHGSGAQLEVVCLKRVSLKLENHADVSLLMSESPVVLQAASVVCDLLTANLRNIYSCFSYVNFRRTRVCDATLFKFNTALPRFRGIACCVSSFLAPLLNSRSSAGNSDCRQLLH
jgi:hypothetical protein